MSEWTDLVTAHWLEVQAVASALEDVINRQRGDATAWCYVGSGTMPADALRLLCEGVAAAALGIVAERQMKRSAGSRNMCERKLSD